eukprot:gene7814-biopygen4588
MGCNCRRIGQFAGVRAEDDEGEESPVDVELTAGWGCGRRGEEQPGQVARHDALRQMDRRRRVQQLRQDKGPAFWWVAQGCGESISHSRWVAG